MKWLELETYEPRDKVLTARITKTAQEQMEHIKSYLEKKYKKPVSQADILLRLIEVAFEETKKK